MANVTEARPVGGVIFEPDSALPKDLVLLRRFAHWMDDAIPIPGTNRRIGLDPLIGLVPGLGDAAGAIVGALFLLAAIRHRVGARTLFRMSGSIAVDLLVGTIPVLGDFFDVFYTSNLDNVERIVASRHRAKKPRGAGGMLAVLGLALAVLLVVLALGVVVLPLLLLRASGI